MNNMMWRKNQATELTDGTFATSYKFKGNVVVLGDTLFIDKVSIATGEPNELMKSLICNYDTSELFFNGDLVGFAR